MKEMYHLDTKIVPTIPVPHDCVVKEIRLEDNILIFIFEDDISYHDSIQNIRPGAKSLMIRFHLIQDIYDINLFVQSTANRFLHKPGVYREIDLIKDSRALFALAGKRHQLEYLDHHVGYCSIIVKLCASNNIVLEMTADSVELEWVDEPV